NLISAHASRSGDRECAERDFPFGVSNRIDGTEASRKSCAIQLVAETEVIMRGTTMAKTTTTSRRNILREMNGLVLVMLVLLATVAASTMTEANFREADIAAAEAQRAEQLLLAKKKAAAASYADGAHCPILKSETPKSS
ncbi:MAG: hypothetical protein AAFR60_07100, partial [Pseudomonadota bacterium]